ncbi:hypothetical protein VOLCADRAFT_106590 [Volvox carteri f. nagariensis]|uniref:Uncharacterized protein n=1 Tax=Volvox carteri f. nagariensis TaxID=3068 RepID=D8U8E2_VOLCA|nr:uncharacterized protein VOLCADRAFT_106590 [Volvox carteri f. nagariensis]EFJ43961.1 hypothetical protein VOLCADRAFT_106590 [Volvox carteri f. nagariensis]|eukprot:XP_002954973.1 hypothetical protein VOLCADRAFT_106590 [Volvox carteri f. nagariensis]
MGKRWALHTSTSKFQNMSTLTAVLLLLATMKACEAAAAAVKTACPQKGNFQVWADLTWQRGVSAVITNLTALTAAEVACRSDPSCVSFNNLGQTIRGEIASLTAQVGTCTYIKGVCPRRTGYTAYNHTTFSMLDGVEGARRINVSSADEVQDVCDKDPSCPSFAVLAPSTNGNLAVAGFYGSSGPVQAYSFQYNTCTYVKDGMHGHACPPKIGYTNLHHTTASGPSPDYFAYATTGYLSGVMPRGAAAAEEACLANSKCTAWSTDGDIWIGGVVSLNQRAFCTCTYVKDDCPLMPGFTAYTDLKDATTSPASRNITLSLSDTRTRCIQDTNCKGFDMLRNFWTLNLNPTASQEGMCTYVRAAGF